MWTWWKTAVSLPLTDTFARPGVGGMPRVGLGARGTKAYNTEEIPVSVAADRDRPPGMSNLS